VNTSPGGGLNRSDSLGAPPAPPPAAAAAAELAPAPAAPPLLPPAAAAGPKSLKTSTCVGPRSGPAPYLQEGQDRDYVRAAVICMHTHDQPGCGAPQVCCQSSPWTIQTRKATHAKSAVTKRCCI
jgi:hypothetical protein